MTNHAHYKSWCGVVAIGVVSIGGCNQLIGFKDVSVEGDAPTEKDAPIDTFVAHDAMQDGPAPKLYVYITNAAFQGGFGATTGPRATADAKCQDKYNFSFPDLGCTNIHAVIQIDDNVDSIARMKITFPIPLMTEVQRATDDHTPVAANWDDFVNPNDQLLAPVSTDPSPQRFWSGRSNGGTNLSCTGWTSSVSGQSGTSGDAAKTFNWTADANVTCDNGQPFVCTCW